jgi:hypothetical protein
MNNILDTINRKRHQSLPVCLIKDSMLQLSSKFLSYSDGDHITDLYFMRTSSYTSLKFAFFVLWISLLVLLAWSHHFT